MKNKYIAVFYEDALNELTILEVSKEATEAFDKGAILWIAEDRRYVEMIGWYLD